MYHDYPKYRVGDLVVYTPVDSDNHWPGVIVNDPSGSLPDLIQGEWVYLVDFGIGKPLPEGETTLTLRA